MQLSIPCFGPACSFFDLSRVTRKTKCSGYRNPQGRDNFLLFLLRKFRNEDHRCMINVTIKCLCGAEIRFLRHRQRISGEQWKRMPSRKWKNEESSQRSLLSYFGLIEQNSAVSEPRQCAKHPAFQLDSATLFGEPGLLSSTPASGAHSSSRLTMKDLIPPVRQGRCTLSRKQFRWRRRRSPVRSKTLCPCRAISLPCRRWSFRKLL